MLTAYLAGVGLGMALITPIGPQNMFVLKVGFAAGVPRVLAATIAATMCDALLIALGTLGAGAVLSAVPAARLGLLACGVVFLAYLGLHGLRAGARDAAPGEEDAAPGEEVRRRLFGQAAAVSLLNPHALLDTVGTIGPAAAAQPGGLGAVFAVGAVSASLLWFLALGVGAAAIRRRLSVRVRGWIQRTSAAGILAAAIILLLQLVETGSSSFMP